MHSKTCSNRFISSLADVVECQNTPLDMKCVCREHMSWHMTHHFQILY